MDFFKYADGIRFVDLDHSRRYNCTVCKWWLDFLAHAAVYVLPNHKPKYNKYVRQLAYQLRQNAASLFALVTCKPAILKSILLEGAKKLTKTSLAIENDFKAVQYLAPEEFERVYKENIKELNGLDFWQQFFHLQNSTPAEFEAFIDEALGDLCDGVLFEVGIIGREEVKS